MKLSIHATSVSSKVKLLQRYLCLVFLVVVAIITTNYVINSQQKSALTTHLGAVDTYHGLFHNVLSSCRFVRTMHSIANGYEPD